MTSTVPAGQMKLCGIDLGEKEALVAEWMVHSGTASPSEESVPHWLLESWGWRGGKESGGHEVI